MSIPASGGRGSAEHRPPIDPRVFDGTCLSGMPAHVAAQLLEGAREFVVRTGDGIFPGDDGHAHVGVLLDGSSRTYLTAADARQLTIRYGRPGSLVSRRADLGADRAATQIQAVTDCRILEIERETLMRLGQDHPSIAMALVDELSARLQDVYATVADTAFGSMRQRLARHLLALAEAQGSLGHGATATVTQQQLADGIGSAREVVARTLAILRSEGLIRTAPGEIEILDVRRLVSFLGEWRTDTHRLEPDLTFEAERLLEASPNAILAVDRDGAIVFMNSSAERLFGWSAQRLTGQPIEILVPMRLRMVHADHRYRFFEAPHARPMGLGLELRGCRQDGSEFPMAASLTSIDTRDGTMVVVTVVELAEPSAAPRT